MRLILPIRLLLLLLAFVAARAGTEPLIWRLDRLDKIGGVTPEILGAPRVVREADGVSIHFNGAGDGLLLPVNPVAGWTQFTVEVLVRPDADGAEEQRFVHFQATGGERGLIELRLARDGRWCIDTFLWANTPTGIARLVLIDRTRLHPAGEWHWIALRYDGRHMSHYVDGVKEQEGEVAIPALGTGSISLGMRLNKIFWFKGSLRELRFHPVALEPAQLQRVGKN